MSPIPSTIQKALEAASLPSSGASLSGNVLTLSTGQKLFARTLSSASDIAQARGEAEGLHHMGLTSPLAPKLYRWHHTEGDREAVILSEYLSLGGRMDEAGQRALARSLADMHRPLGTEGPQADRENREKAGLPVDGTVEKDKLRFGFPVPTHCGVTRQDNTWEEDWATFFRDRRLGDLVRRIDDQTVSAEWDIMQARAIPLLLNNIEPAPIPVILHGDLWSGNKGMATSRSSLSESGVASQDGPSPAIFDPASYFGHNEADLGIMHMFGGFSAAFFDEYHKHHPRSSPYYDERQKLYELYHHLNHTLMFGGGYKGGTLGIMRQLNKWAESVS